MEKEEQPQPKGKRVFSVEMEDDGDRYGGLKPLEQVVELEKLVKDAGYSVVGGVTEYWEPSKIPDNEPIEVILAT